MCNRSITTTTVLKFLDWLIIDEVGLMSGPCYATSRFIIIRRALHIILLLRWTLSRPSNLMRTFTSLPRPLFLLIVTSSSALLLSIPLLFIRAAPTCPCDTIIRWTLPLLMNWLLIVILIHDNLSRPRPTRILLHVDVNIIVLWWSVLNRSPSLSLFTFLGIAIHGASPLRSFLLFLLFLDWRSFRLISFLVGLHFLLNEFLFLFFCHAFELLFFFLLLLSIFLFSLFLKFHHLFNIFILWLLSSQNLDLKVINGILLLFLRLLLLQLVLQSM